MAEGKAEDQTEGQRDELAERLKALGERIEGHRKGVEGSSGEEPARSGFGEAMKISTEFIVSVVVGAGLGYGLDQLTGLAPLFMILFLLLGFCAGVLGVMRSAGLVAKPDIYLSREQRRRNKSDKKV